MSSREGIGLIRALIRESIGALLEDDQREKDGMTGVPTNLDNVSDLTKEMVANPTAAKAAWKSAAKQGHGNWEDAAQIAGMSARQFRRWGYKNIPGGKEYVKKFMAGLRLLASKDAKDRAEKGALSAEEREAMRLVTKSNRKRDSRARETRKNISGQ